MKKLLAPFILSTVVVFGIFACLSGDGNNTGGGGVGNGGTLEVVGIDQVNGIIITRFITHHCEGTRVWSDTSTDTSNYVISGDSLMVWNVNGDCGADVFTGTSNTIIGTWNLTPVVVPIPAANRPANCTGVVPPYDDGLNNLLVDIPGGQISIVVSATSVRLSITGQVCLAQEGAAYFIDNFTGVTASNSTCTAVTLHNEANNKNAQITSSTSDGTVTVVFQHGANSCTGYELMPIPGGSLPNCSLPGMDNDMMTCILASGFFTTP